MHREEGEVCSLHLLIAALGLHRLGLIVLLLDAALHSFLSSLFHSVIFSGDFLEQKLPHSIHSSSLVLALPHVS